MLNDDAKKARSEYNKLLKSLDAQARQALKEHLDLIGQMIDGGGISVKDIGVLVNDLQGRYKKILRDNSVIAIDFAKKVKAADFKPYMDEVKRLLLTQKFSAEAIKQITDLNNVSAVFGGGLDKEIVNSVWNKVWPDALKLDDRVNVLSNKMMQYVEMTVKQGISEGKSSYNIFKELKQHLLVEGKESRAFYRLAVHTTNMCYQKAQAEISVQANFVMGIRVVRGYYGPADLNCDICDEHGGQDYKEYFKNDFGGRDTDMYVMTNMPGYHPNCNCGVETIYETALQFVNNARKGLSDRSYKEGWE